MSCHKQACLCGEHSWWRLNIKRRSLGRKKRKLKRKEPVRGQQGACHRRMEISDGSHAFLRGLKNCFRQEASCYFSVPADGREQMARSQHAPCAVGLYPLNPCVCSDTHLTGQGTWAGPADSCDYQGTPAGRAPAPGASERSLSEPEPRCPT